MFKRAELSMALPLAHVLWSQHALWLAVESSLALETEVFLGFLGARVRDAHAGRRTEPSILWGWSSWIARMLK